MMDSVVESLILDLLEWVTKEERTYEEVVDAWRTSCPKLPVWEDATDRRLVTVEVINGRHIVEATSSGKALLQQRRSSRP